MENIIRTTKPISENSASFYFEAKVVNSGKDGIVAIGLTQTNPNTRTGLLPGWDKDPSLGIGYHNHGTGGIYHGNTYHAVEPGEPYRTGDVVGCYICRTQMNGDEINLVQFTKNGAVISSPRVITNDEWYPTIGIGSPGVLIESNFGENTFFFNPSGKHFLL